LNAIVNKFAVWRKQSSRKAPVGDREWLFSMTTPDHTLQIWRKRPFRNSTGIVDSSTSALHSGPCPIGLPPLPLSLQQSGRRGVSFNNDAELQNWLDELFTAKPADLFKRGSKTCSNVVKQPWIMEENT
jgi:hypothetical protein